MRWERRSIGVPGRLDDDVAVLLARAAELDLPPLAAMVPAEARAEFLRRCAKTNPVPPEGVEAADVTIRGKGGPLTLRLYRPAAAAGTLPALLYCHGGGFVLGGLESHDAICRTIAAEAGSVVVAVDYRLAPEHPYPAAVEDAVAALDWLNAGPAELGGRLPAIAVGGDSAGGTLAAVLALHARDRGMALALQVLVYPAVDQGGDYPSRRRLAEGHLLTADEIAWFSRQYFGPRAEPELAADASPIRAPSHAGLAPALIITAAFDPLADEGAAYAERLRAAGVQVRHVLLEGGIHGCLGLARRLACGKAVLEEICAVWRSVASPVRRT
jgi:acetyl esterase